jgi:hypothetical protein
MLPVIVTGGQVQVGRVNVNVLVPMLEVTVSVKLIGVPQAKLGDVLTE